MEHLIAAAMAGVNMTDADNDLHYYSMMAEEGAPSKSASAYTHMHGEGVVNRPQDFQDVDEDAPLSEDDDSEGGDDVINNYSDRHHDIPQDRHHAASMTTRASLSAATSSPCDVIAASWQSTFKQIRDFHDLGHRHYPPRLAAWLDAQRRRYVAYGTGRIAPIGIVGNRIRQLDSIEIDWIGRIGNKVKVENRSSYEVNEDDDTNDDVSVSMPPPPGRSSTKYNKGRNRGATTTLSQGRSSGLLASVKRARGSSAHLQPWTTNEDEAIGKLRKLFGGNKWSKIARTFDNGRTDSEIKNRWASIERHKARRLRHKGMDEEDDDDVEDEGKETEETGEDDDSSVNNNRDPTDQVQGLVRAALESERRKSLSKPSRASTRLPPRNESTTSSAVKRPFPETLFLLVNKISTTKPHVLSWVSVGQAFEVRDPDLLSPLLSRYFRHNNYSSLARMLQMYGFTKTNSTGSATSTFQHPNFTRSSRVESLALRVTRDMVAAKSSSEDPSPTSSSLMRGKTMRTLSKSEDTWRPRPGGSRESSRISSTKHNNSNGVSDPKFLFDLPTKGGRRPPLSRSSPDDKNIKKEDEYRDYSGNDPLVGATIFVHSGKFQGRKGELVDRRERGWSTIKGIPKRVQVQFFAVVDDGKVDLNAARSMSRSMPCVMTTSQVAKALEALDGDIEDEDEEDALERTPEKKKRSDHLVGASVYITQGAFVGYQGTLEARGDRGWCNISGITKRIKINSFSIVNDGKIDLKAARAMRLFTPPVMTPAQVTKALESIELDDDDEEGDDDDNEEQGDTNDPAIKKERPVDHLVGATVYVTHGKFRGQTGALEERGDRGWCNISGITKRIKINSFSVVNDGKFDLKAARAMPRFMPPVMTPAQVTKALESIELDDDEEIEDDDNYNGAPESNSKNTRVVDHLVGATVYIDTGLFIGQSGTLVDRRERGWCTITGIERRVQVTYFVVVDDGKVDLDAARAMSRSMPRVWSTTEVTKALKRLNGKILSMEQSEDFFPDEIDGDDSDDSGDPPFRKAGHPHLGKRVRHFLQPGGSEGDYIDGTVTGYLSPSDVDSKGNPAFTCTRTKRPAALFRIACDANNRAQLKYKDLEMSEVEEALRHKLESRANSSVKTLTSPKVELVLPGADNSPGEYPKWNLGKQSSVPGVQYFKSDVGEYWIEQVVPRKNDSECRCDTYYLNPDGLRFRSIKSVHRFLDGGDDNEQEIFAPKKGYDSADDGEVEAMDIAPNDDVASFASSSEQEESKPEGGEEGCLNPCSCKKSRCLKLYCECFNKGLYCTSDCYCIDCRNKPSNATQRDAVIADILARNKDAFKPRIKSSIECRCKRSACLKKYCDCYNHGVYCNSEICRCKGCENEDPEKTDKKKKAKLEPSAHTSQYDDIYRSYSSIDASSQAAVPYQKNGVVFESSVNVKSEWQPKKSYAALKNDAIEDQSLDSALGIKLNDFKGGKTIRCPKCMKDFQFSCAKTAGASFSRHVRTCEGGTSEKDLELQKVRERKQIARNDTMNVGKPPPPSRNKWIEKPTMNYRASTDDDLSAQIASIGK